MLAYQKLLQLPYQDFIAKVLQEAPNNCTWTEISDWLSNQYTPEQIAEMYAKLYNQLCILYAIEDDFAANDLRYKMDIFWYAGDSQLNEKAIIKK